MSGDRAESVVSFLCRLERLGPLLVAIAPERPDLLFELKGRDRVCLELSREPVVVSQGSAVPPAAVTITAEAEDLHRILKGDENAADSLGKRRLLLKGSMHLIARVFPLLSLATPLYRQHLREVGAGRRGGASAAAQRVASLWARELGARLSGADRAELLGVLDSLALGVSGSRPGGPAEAKPDGVADPAEQDNPLDRPSPGSVGAVRSAARRHYARMGGSTIGTVVFKLGGSVDLVEVLGALSDGLAAARRGGDGADAR